MAYVFEAGVSQRLYIDGVRVGTQAVSAPLIYDTNSMCIGRDTESGSPIYFFNGGIDEAAFYNRAATDSEIAAIHAAGVAGKALPGTGDNEDSDGNGLSNLAEYRLNTSPANPNGLLPAMFLTQPDGSQQLTLTLLRDPRRSDITLTVDSSGDLSQWETIATSHLGGAFTGIAGISGETAGTAPRWVNISDSRSAGPDKKRFIRVTVTR